MSKRCERVRRTALDARITGRSRPEEVDDHVRECAACRAEISAQDALWHELGRMPLPMPSAVHMEQIATRLREEITISPGEGTRMKFTWLAAAALAGTLLGGAGTALLRDRAPEAAPSGQQFLLLLHEAAGAMNFAPEQLPAIIEEYGAWAGQLAAEQRLVAAEKLRDDSGRWLGKEGEQLTVDRTESVSGFFLIRAANYDEAVAIARRSPHLKYGGTIEVRGIEDTSSH